MLRGSGTGEVFQSYGPASEMPGMLGMYTLASNRRPKSVMGFVYSLATLRVVGTIPLRCLEVYVPAT